VYVDDLDIPVDRLTEGAKRVMDRAVEDTRRREHSLVSAMDFLRLPPGVKLLVVVMLWPAIWAGALFIGAFAGDVIRQDVTIQAVSKKVW